VIKSIYEGVAVDPSHWPAFYTKTLRMFRSEPTMATSDIKGVITPTLVLAGDDDCIQHGHTVELFETLHDAQLAIVPGTSHMVQLEKAALVNQLILDFLAENGPPGTLYPMRRARA
jgi:pimeloyl-ACP methyl ester carboxylesterase